MISDHERRRLIALAERGVLFKQQGRCRACGRSAHGTGQLCILHARWSRLRRRRLYDARRDRSLCTRCGDPLDTGLWTYCRRCARRRRLLGY